MSFQARTYDDEANVTSYTAQDTTNTIQTNRGPLLDFRRKWVPGANSVFNSAADVASDWYYIYTLYDAYSDQGSAVLQENLDLLAPLLAVSIVSTLMFIMTFMTYCAKAGNPNANVCCVDAFKKAVLKCFCCCDPELDTKKFISLVEDVFEDVPTIVLTAMIEIRRGGGASPGGIISIATSSFNLVYNFFNILLPKDAKEE